MDFTNYGMPNIPIIPNGSGHNKTLAIAYNSRKWEQAMFDLSHCERDDEEWVLFIIKALNVEYWTLVKGGNK